MAAMLTPIVFAVLSLAFAGFAMRDRMRHGGTLTLAARIWLRMALIFAVVSGGLLWLGR